MKEQGGELPIGLPPAERPQAYIRGLSGRPGPAQTERHPAEQPLMVCNVLCTQRVPILLLGRGHLAIAQRRRIASLEIRVQRDEDRCPIGPGHAQGIVVGSDRATFGQHAEQRLERHAALAVAVLRLKGMTAHEQRVVAPRLYRPREPPAVVGNVKATAPGRSALKRTAMIPSGWLARTSRRKCTPRALNVTRATASSRSSWRR